MRAVWLIIAIGLAPAGCALRDAPYRFRAPGVAGVTAADLERRGAREVSDGYDDQGRREHDEVGFAVDARPGELAPVSDPESEASAPRDPLAETLRAMVGLRERDATDVGFVMSALATLGAAIDDDLRASADGPALLAMAEARQATTTEHTPLLGDLVVFDRVTRGEAASALGVVVSSRDDGTVEFVYLRRGVVRRGFMNREHPDQKRGPAGRVLNTIMRQRSGSGSKGQGDLTAQVFATYIRLDALSDR